MLREPIEGEALRFLNLRGRHLRRGDSLFFRRLSIPLRCREIKPHVRLYIVQREALTSEVQEAKAVLAPWASPCSAAWRNHFAASAWSYGTS